VLDGYPRNCDQARDLERVLADLRLALDRAILMDLDFDVLLKRLTGRRTCSTTGKVVNIYFSPPQELDQCLRSGGELLQREDDNEAVIRNRLQVYERETAPLIEHYRGSGLLKVVSASGSVDEVYTRLCEALHLDRS
jgi:adenylate kinase